MERMIGDRTILDEFAEDFCSIVERHCRYIVVSGFVAIAHGRSRATEDIDMIIEKIGRDRFLSLHKELADKGFICIQGDDPIDLYDSYLSQEVSIRYTRDPDFAPPEMEIKLAKDEIDELQIESRIKIPITGLDIWFSSIEMNIAFKEELLASDKDMEDAKHLRIVYTDNISEEKVREIKDKIRRIRMHEKGA